MQLDCTIHASLTQKRLSQLSIRVPYVALRILCDSGLLQCYSSVAVALVLVDLLQY